MAGKVKVAAIRALHAHLETILADYDARNSGETDGEDGAGSGLGAKTLEENDHGGGGSGPAGEDDPPEFNGKPKNPVTNGNMLVGAKDEAFQFDGEHVKIVRGLKALSKAVPGMDRLTAVNLDTRKRGLTAIQPSEGVRSINALAESFKADTQRASDALFTSGRK